MARCMRLYPHDDNQGGFFVAVIEKSGGTESQETDPWLNTKIRQKPILEELAEFSKWYEEIYAQHCEENNIPEEFRKVLQMSKEVEETQRKEKEKSDALGIPCSNLTAEKRKMEDKREVAEFPFVGLVKTKPEVWFELLSYYGIDHSFPADYLYEHTVGGSRNIMLLNQGLHQLMSHKKKFKLDVVNLGLKVFSMNKENKSECQYRIMQDAVDVLLPYMDISRQIHLKDGAFFKALNGFHDNQFSFKRIGQ